MTVSAGDWRESVAKRSRIAGREKNDPGWNQDCAAVLSLVVLCIDVFAAEFAGSLCILLDTLNVELFEGIQNPVAVNQSPVLGSGFHSDV